MELKGKRVRCKINIYNSGRLNEKRIEARFIKFYGCTTSSYPDEGFESKRQEAMALVLADDGQVHNVNSETIQFLTMGDDKLEINKTGMNDVIVQILEDLKKIMSRQKLEYMPNYLQNAYGINIDI